MTENDDGPKQVSDYYFAVGRLMNLWAMVDGSLYHLFDICLGADSEKAAVIFFRIGGFSTRLSLLDRMAEMHMSETDYATWSGIRSKLAALVATRNLIAHSPVKMTKDYEVVWHDVSDRENGYILYPKEYDIRRSYAELKDTKRRPDPHTHDMLMANFEATAAQLQSLVRLSMKLRPPPEEQPSERQ